MKLEKGKWYMREQEREMAKEQLNVPARILAWAKATISQRASEGKRTATLDLLRPNRDLEHYLVKELRKEGFKARVAWFSGLIEISW